MYVPVLKARSAEFTAIANHASRTGLLPLFELIADENRGTGSEAMYALEHLANAWPQPHLLDVHNLASDADGRALAWELANVWLRRRTHGVAIPCVAATDDRDVFDAVAPVVAAADRLALRVDAHAADPSTLPATLATALARVGFERSRTMVILDWLDQPTTTNLDTLESRTRELLRAIGSGWGNVVVEGTAAGPSPSAIGPAAPRGRREWWLWLRLHQTPEPSVPDVAFGDYAGFPAPQPGSGRARIATVRYSGPTHLRIYRERDDDTTKTPGFQLCSRQIVASADFRGAVFSGGDSTIANGAAGLAGGGGATGWRVAALDHHLALVLTDLASPPAAPGPGTV